MYIFKIAYDGRYSFQQQPHKETVCDKILEVFSDILKERKIIYSGGRTDKGVSALGNFVVLNLKEEPNIRYLNYKLKDYGIWILGFKEIENIPEVKYRHYRYILPNINYNVENIRLAAKKFIGKKSFHNFSKKDRTKNKSPIREIYSIDIKENSFFLTIDIIGKSFLWQMVRKIVGALHLVGKEIKEVEWIDKLFKTNYKEGAPTMPAEGLILVEAKTDIQYNYDKYIINKFKHHWEKEFYYKVMKVGISKTVLELCPGGAEETHRAG